MSGEFEPLARRVLAACAAHNVMLATAESCTGGMIAAALTDIPGSSKIVDCGFVTYSNEAKIRMLDVSKDTLREHGAVSAEVAREMASGALHHSPAGIAVSVTGIAGPDGGSEEKPVGLVWIGLARKGHLDQARRHQFTNLGRAHIREETVRAALTWVAEALETH